MFEFARWLGSSPLSIGIQSVSWLTPLLQAIHIVMIGIVFVSVLMIVLRIHGRVRADEPFIQTWQRFAPWLWTALSVMAATGLVLTIGEPVREATALSFWLKMILIAVAVASVLGLRRAVARVAGPTIPPATRHAAKLVLLVWILIIFLGRAIAYDVEVWRSLSLVHQA
jgi:cbb3-type cytochrome oxidase subunit 3